MSVQARCAKGKGDNRPNRSLSELSDYCHATCAFITMYTQASKCFCDNVEVGAKDSQGSVLLCISQFPNRPKPILRGNRH